MIILKLKFVNKRGQLRCLCAWSLAICWQLLLLRLSIWIRSTSVGWAAACLLLIRIISVWSGFGRLVCTSIYLNIILK